MPTPSSFRLPVFYYLFAEDWDLGYASVWLFVPTPVLLLGLSVRSEVHAWDVWAESFGVPFRQGCRPPPSPFCSYDTRPSAAGLGHPPFPTTTTPSSAVPLWSGRVLLNRGPLVLLVLKGLRPFVSFSFLESQRTRVKSRR